MTPQGNRRGGTCGPASTSRGLFRRTDLDLTCVPSALAALLLPGPGAVACSSSFGRFFRVSVAGARSADHRQRCAPAPHVSPSPSDCRAGDDLYPCPLPLWDAGPPPRSNRRRARWARERDERLWACGGIAYLNWLALGQPREPPSSCASWRVPTAAQSALIGRVRNQIGVFSRRSVGAWRGKRKDLHDELRRLAGGVYDGAPAGGPLWLTPENASLPACAATVDLAGEHTHPTLAQIYAEPFAFDRLPDEVPRQIPRACSRVRRWPELCARMFEAGMIKLALPWEVTKANDVPLIAEFFGVSKKDVEVLRVILDRRPRNAAEVGLDVVLQRLWDRGLLSSDDYAFLVRLTALPHPSQLEDLLICSDEEARVSSEDVCEFYHALRWPPERWSENAVGQCVFPEELIPFVSAGRAAELRALAKEHRSIALQPLLISTGMGDVKSSRVAQAFGQWLIRRAGGLSEESWVSYGWPPPAGNLWVGSYLDDLLVLMIATLEAFDEVDSADKIELERIRAAHRQAGTTLHDKKRVFQEKSQVIWGAEIRGDSGKVRGESEAALQLAVLTLGFLSVPIGWRTATRLVSTWTHHAMFSRIALSLFSEVYVWIADLKSSGGKKRMPPGVVDEFLGMAVLFPFFEVNARTPFLGEVFASDATTTRGAVVRAEVTPEQEAFAWARVPRRGGYSRLFVDIDEDLPGDEPFARNLLSPDPLLYDLVASLSWQPVVAWAFGGDAHIGIREASALRTVCRRLGKRPSTWDSRVICFVDAQAIRSAFMRGRSASRLLNRILKQSLPYLMPTNIRPLVPWLPSAENPADDPTRFARLREPRPASPELVEALDRTASTCPRAFRFAKDSRRVRAAAQRTGPLDRAPRVPAACATSPVPVEGASATGAPRLSSGPAGSMARSVRAAKSSARLQEPVKSLLPKPAPVKVPVPKMPPASACPDAAGGPLRLLDVCSGANEPLSKEARRRGWHATSIDVLLGGDAHNLADPVVLEKLCARIKAREFDLVVLAPPCSTFSPMMRLCKWSTRTSRCPMGGVGGRRLAPKEIVGNAILRACLRLAEACNESKVPWALENPRPSLMWKTRGMRVLLERTPDCVVVDFDWCRFQRSWKKTTRLAGSAACVRQLACRCEGGHVHERLEGTVFHPPSGRWRSRTSIAAEYSVAFCRRFLAAFEGDLRSARVVARYGGRAQRQGEASNPGPWGNRQRFADPVDLRLGVTEPAQKRYDDAIARYDRWARLHGLPLSGCFDDLSERQVNALLVAALQQMTVDRAPLSLGPNLLAGIMRKVPWLRGRLSEAWFAMGVWSRAAPSTTRTGIDARVLRAMAALALVWEWPLVALLLLLGFHGLLRPNEMCQLRRCHIRLPSDAQGLDSPGLILLLVRAKTRFRAGRVQSVVVTHEATNRLAERCLHRLRPQDLLLPGGGGQLRRFFSLLLGALGIVHEGLTPSSVRPGGAVHIFRAGNHDLLRLMYHGRWDNPRTLQHYLNEGTALQVAMALPGKTAALVMELSNLLNDLIDGA